MTNPEIVEWIRTAPGVKMNPDNYYGLQCVDLANQYAMDIFGIAARVAFTGVTGARQLLDAASDAYFIRTDNDPNNPNLIPKQGDVVVWGGSAINQWGHVAVVDSADQNGMWVIQQDGFAAPLKWANGAMYSDKPAHRAYLPYYGAGTGMVKGWLTPRENKIVGYKAPTPAAPKAPSLTSLQRLAVEGANYRPEPNTNKEPTQTFHAGDVLNFVGFVHGSTPPGGNSDIWLKGIGGGYVHVSAVVGGSEKGLPDLSPPKPAPVVSNPSERTVGAKGANQRSGPSTSFPVTVPLEAGFTFVAKGWVKGEAPKDETNRIWFVGNNSGGYVWSGACTDSSIGSLPDLTPKATPAPVTPSKSVTPTPIPPVVSTPSPNPVEPPVVIPTLVAEFPAVDEVFPAHPDNYQVGNMPEKPTHVAIHEFGGFNIPQSSVKTYFAQSLADRKKANPNAGPTSAEFSVGEDGHCIQHVSIHDRAFHAGPGGNSFRSVETHSKQTPAVIAKTRLLIRQQNDALGYELIPILHKDIPGNSTKCGTNINLADYQNIGFTPKTSDKPTKEDILKEVDSLRSLIERY